MLQARSVTPQAGTKQLKRHPIRLRYTLWRQLGHQGQALGQLHRPPGTHRRRPELGQQAAPAGHAGLARTRVALVRRAKVLSVQPATRHITTRTGEHDQGALDLRAGPPEAQERTWPRSLRGTVVDRLHRYALKTCIASAYLQNLHLAEYRRTGRRRMTTRFAGPPPSPSLPAMRQASIRYLLASLATLDLYLVAEGVSNCRPIVKCPGNVRTAI